MSATQTFRELTYTMRPQDPHGDGTGLRFETGEHGGDHPDNIPQSITVTDAPGRWALYVPLRVGGKIVVPEPPARLIRVPIQNERKAHAGLAQLLRNIVGGGRDVLVCQAEGAARR